MLPNGNAGATIARVAARGAAGSALCPQLLRRRRPTRGGGGSRGALPAPALPSVLPAPTAAACTGPLALGPAAVPLLRRPGDFFGF